MKTISFIYVIIITQGDFMLKNYNYVLTIMLYPFILIIEFLLFKGNLKGDFYWYLTILMNIIFIPSFIMSLYNSLEEILHSNKKWRIVLLILFPFFYLPIYYTKYISKEEKYLGIILCILGLIFSYLTYKSFTNRLAIWLDELYSGSILVNEHFTYNTLDNLFSMDVSSDFRCKNKDIGDYVISCDKIKDDSFIGVYSYEISNYTEKELSDILLFHLNQSLDYIKEHGYTGEVNNIDDVIEINYHDMVILLTQKNYLLHDSEYSLVIVKEMPKALEEVKEFQKMIETIKFLNYNEEVSS